MKIEKAIEILEHPDWLETESHSPDYQDAINLGIEALRFFKDLEDRGALPGDVMLPGEDRE